MFEQYKRFILGWAIIAVLLIIFYGWQHLIKRERKIGYDQAVAEYTNRALVAEKEVRERESKLNRQLQEAQNAATIRDQQIETLSAAVADSSRRLRDQTITIRNSLSKASLDAVRKTADTALTVFSDCQVKYGELAENADRHASDVRTLIAAWPQ